MIGQRQKIKIGDESLGGVHYYYTPPMPSFETMINFGLKIEDQKFSRVVIPDCFGDLSSPHNDSIDRDEDGNPIWSTEQTSFIDQEYDRRLYGCWYLIKGRPIYLTGDCYFYLNYWWMDAENEDGYPEFRYAVVKYFYFADIVDKDPDVFGGLFVTARRFGKTEMELSRIYNKATTIENKIFALMSLTGDEAKDNLFKKIIRTWDVMFEPFKPKHAGTTAPEKELNFGKPPRKSVKSKQRQSTQKYLKSIISPRKTKVSALQGKKPYYTFVDEAATIDEMNVGKFWSTSKQALALGGGKIIIGKVMMPCTLEEMKDNAGKIYHELWGKSDNTIKINNRTTSGLIRYLKPYWEGLEGFIDEYGFDKEEEAKLWVESTYQQLLDNGERDDAVTYRRQFPRNEKDAFNIAVGKTLEEDCLNILQDVLDKCAEIGQACEIYEIDGEVRIKNIKPHEDALYIIEEPHPNVEYIIGLDGTATDEDSSGKDTTGKRSKFGIVVTKKLEIGKRSYCDVAYIAKYPKKREEMYRISYYLWVYYNKYGKCKVMPEANGGTSSPVTATFTNRGAKRALMYEPKYVGTDIKEFKNRLGFVRTGDMKDLQFENLNMCIRLHGHHFRGKAFIQDVMKTGDTNTDLSDAFQAAMVGWGNFGNIELKKERKSSSYLEMRGKRTFNQATGKWDIKMSIKEKEEENA